MQKKDFAVLIMICLLISCSSDNAENAMTSISGIYKITAMDSDVPIDMNNDGTASTDLYSEISGKHLFTGVSGHMSYDFESVFNLMEARPLTYHTNDAKLIAFNIPDQYISNTSDGHFYVASYIHSFINYSYDVDEITNEIRLTNNNVQLVENGTITNCMKTAEGRIEVHMQKQVFDFLSHQWVSANLTILYELIKE